MSSREKSNISIPSVPREQGLFGRLLQRTRSKREKKPTEQRPSPIHLQSGPSDPVSRKGDQALEVSPLQDPQLPTPTLPPAANDIMAAPVALLPTQQPSGTSLKRKVSVRDRLRRFGREDPTPIPEPEQKKQPRVAYVPKHAASDFARLAVTPRPLSPRPSSRQHQRSSPDEPGTFQSLDTTTVGPYSPRGLQTLAEDEAVHAVPRQAQVCHYDQQAWRQRQSHRPAAESQLGGASLTQPPTVTNDKDGSSTSPIAETGLDQGTTQPSEYERFVARAEERDRAYREQLVRSLSQRQYPRAAEPAYSHQTMDSACVTDPFISSRKEAGRVSGLDSGIGSKSSSHQDRNSGTWERGHRKRLSSTPSFGQGGSDTLEVVDGSGNRAAQQHATLKRQASIKKTLGEYFRPAKPSMGRYEEPEYLPGLKRAGSRRV